MGQQVKPGVTICIPTIAPRSHFLKQAKESVQRQTHKVAETIVIEDKERVGAYATRNAAMMLSETEWTGFLDDDDKLLPHHVEHLLHVAEENDADFVWGWFEVEGGTDPFPQARGAQIKDVSRPHCIPITFMCRTYFMHDAFYHMGGFQFDHEGLGKWEVQDRPFIVDILHRQGAKPFASPEITWTWRHHHHNTSGLGLS